MWITSNWKILKDTGIPDHLTCLLRNLYASQEAIVTGHGTRDWSKLGKEYNKSIYYHPAYLTYMQNTSSKIPGWMNHKLESRLLGEYQQPQICRWYHSNGRKWRGTKEPLDVGERGEWKSQLKIQHSKTKITPFGPIPSWQIDGKVEAMTDFTFLCSTITADGDCSHEIKRHLLLGRKAMTNLDSILKNRDITNKVPYSQSYGFSSSHVWTWELDHKEGWVPKNWCF